MLLRGGSRSCFAWRRLGSFRSPGRRWLRGSFYRASFRPSRWCLRSSFRKALILRLRLSTGLGSFRKTGLVRLRRLGSSFRKTRILTL